MKILTFAVMLISVGCAARQPKVSLIPRAVCPPTVMQPGMLVTETPEYREAIATIVRVGNLNAEYRAKLKGKK